MEMLRHPAVLLAFAYLAVTAIFQFRPLSTRFLDLDRLAILPRWKFFIPNDGRLDLRMEMRGHVAGGAAATVPVNLFTTRRGHSWLWYPEQHRGEVLWLSAQRLALKASRDDMQIGADSVAYQTLVRHVRHSAATHNFETFQFSLIGQHVAGLGERTLFTSECHTR